MKRISEDPSFKPGRVNLEGIGMSIDLPENHFFKLELCKEVIKRVREIRIEYGYVGCMIPEKDFHLLGYMSQVSNKSPLNEIGYFILIQKGLGDKHYTAVLGHEEGHFVEETGSKSKFYELLNINDLGHTEQDFAMLCEFWALHKRGFDITRPCAEDNFRVPLKIEDEIRADLVNRLHLKRTA